MPNDPYNRYEEEVSRKELRQRREVNAKRRQKRTMQRIILFASLAVFAALIIFCVVMILRAVFAPKTPASGTPAGSGTSQASGVDPAASGATGGGPASIPQAGVDWPVATDNTVWNLVLVNGQKPLPAGHSIAEADLATIAFSGVAYYYDARIGNELAAMIEACNAATGGSLRVVSGYRGETTQNNRYNTLIAQGMSDADARRLEPPAGYSEHQTGLAIDFAVNNATAADNSFASTAEYAWLLQSAADYGFILRYSAEKEAITGMVFQPYHFRFVGVQDAQAIRDAGICLEEYLAATSPTTTDGGDDSTAGEA